VHHDGYPEGLGMDIAKSISPLLDSNFANKLSWEIEELQTQHGDLEYIYYIWQGYDKDTYISIFAVGCSIEICQHCDHEIGLEDECIFVGSPEALITAHKLNTTNDR